MTDPLEDRDLLLKRLLQTRAESKYLEWKLSCPVGPSVTKKTKYRIVKAIVSFANTSGGFVLCGVGPKGNWSGLDKTELSYVDPAMITELLNGVILPELPHLNYSELEHRGKKFVVIHTPPSELMPHVTTKEVTDEYSKGNKYTLIAPKAVYCRFGAKSDLATASCFQHIIAKRTDFLRADLLRRIREVPVPVPVPTKRGLSSFTTALRVTKLTDDPNAPVVRLTRKNSEASGIFLHEELSDGLFDEINNVLEANRLLAKGQQRFFLGEPLYYRIYAERHHVVGDSKLFEMLASTAINAFYAPGLFWLQHLTDRSCAEVVLSLYKNPISPSVYHLLRIAVLLGKEFSNWLFTQWQKKWQNHAQPPNYYWTFQTMLNRKDIKVPVLVALRSMPNTKFQLPDTDSPQTYGTLSSSPVVAAKLLSDSCLRVFEEDHRFKSIARKLDILAYGETITRRTKEIGAQVIELATQNT